MIHISDPYPIYANWQTWIHWIKISPATLWETHRIVCTISDYLPIPPDDRRPLLDITPPDFFGGGPMHFTFLPWVFYYGPRFPRTLEEFHKQLPSEVP